MKSQLPLAAGVLLFALPLGAAAEFATAAELANVVDKLEKLQSQVNLQSCHGSGPMKSNGMPENSSRLHADSQDHEWYQYLTGSETMRGDNSIGFFLYSSANLFKKLDPTFSSPHWLANIRQFGKSPRVNVQAVAQTGDKALLVEFLENHPGLVDVALASAAVGAAAYMPELGGPALEMRGMRSYNAYYDGLAGDLASALEWNLDARKELVRDLFTRGASGNTTFMNQVFQKYLEEDIQIPEDMMHVLAWGQLRILLGLVKASGSLAPQNTSCNNFTDALAALAVTSLKSLSVRTKILPSLSDVPPSLLDYIVKNPHILQERTSHGRTLLMEASVMQGCGEKGNWSDSRTFEVVKGLYAQLDEPVDAVTDAGETASWLAGMEGYLNRSKELEESKASVEEKQTPLVFHFQNMFCLVFALHVGVGLANLLFGLCRPGADPTTTLRKTSMFLVKVSILALVNVVIKYQGLLLYWFTQPVFFFHFVSVVSVNIDVMCSWKLFVVLLVLLLLFASQDFKKACTMPHAASATKVKSTNMYEDPNVPFWRCLATFLLASLFLAVYASSVLILVKMTLFSRFFWSCSLLLQTYLCLEPNNTDEASSGQLSEILRWVVRWDGQGNPDVWAALLQQSNLSISSEIAPKLSKSEVCCRFFMHLISNGIFRIFILYTLPVYLATSGQPSDFALNAFAVTFISDLDNQDELEYEVVGTDYAPLLALPGESKLGTTSSA
mmetsp:Transcript_44707/g.104161  ORF Transcript_44707/g.104161 Transcript_44707/m.104161 type:complete len:726 (+) Transcript_44707:76-2253(+)